MSVCFMTARKVGKLRKKWIAIGLALIIISSAALSLYWAFLVPIFQGPDEPAHFDYAIRIYTAGRLLRDGDTGFSTGSGAHPLTTYLCASTNCDVIRLHPDEKAPAGYGGTAFYRDLDRGAPDFDESTRSDTPVMLTMYPFGYYTLAALWVAVIRDFSTRATASFFGLRILSLVLLSGSLLLV